MTNRLVSKASLLPQRLRAPLLKRGATTSLTYFNAPFFLLLKADNALSFFTTFQTWNFRKRWTCRSFENNQQYKMNGPYSDLLDDGDEYKHHNNFYKGCEDYILKYLIIDTYRMTRFGENCLKTHVSPTPSLTPRINWSHFNGRHTIMIEQILCIQ